MSLIILKQEEALTQVWEQKGLSCPQEQDAAQGVLWRDGNSTWWGLVQGQTECPERTCVSMHPEDVISKELARPSFHHLKQMLDQQHSWSVCCGHQALLMDTLLWAAKSRHFRYGTSTFRIASVKILISTNSRNEQALWPLRRVFKIPTKAAPRKCSSAVGNLCELFKNLNTPSLSFAFLSAPRMLKTIQSITRLKTQGNEEGLAGSVQSSRTAQQRGGGWDGREVRSSRDRSAAGSLHTAN